MRPSMVFLTAAALGVGVLWGVLIASLCQAAKRGDELNERAWREVDLDAEWQALEEGR